MDDPNEKSSEAPIVIYSAAHESEAAIVVNALSNAGIHAKAHGEFSAGFRAEAPGDVKVFVNPGDVDAAKIVLEDIKTDEEIDWENVDVGEPDA